MIEYLNYDNKKDYINIKEAQRKVKLEYVAGKQIYNDFKTLNPKFEFPCVIFNKNEIEYLKNLEKKEDSFVNKSVELIIKKADEWVEKAPVFYDDHKIRKNYPIIHELSAPLDNLCFAYHYTNNEKYAKAAWEHIQPVLDATHWDGIGNEDLETTIACKDVATVFDCCYNYLNNEQRNMLIDAFMQKGVPHLRKVIADNEWWVTTYINWAGVCHGSLGVACLVFMNVENEDVKNASLELLEVCINNLEPFVSSFEPDGQSEEGLLYWRYGLGYLMPFVSALYRHCGTDYGRTDTPALKYKSHLFFANMAGPVATISYGDDHIPKLEKLSSGVFNTLSRIHNDKVKATYQYIASNGVCGWLVPILDYKPELVESNHELNLPLDGYFRDADIVSFRSSWNENAIYVSAHAGDNRANHAHMDAGEFFIQANGKVWAVGSLGRQDYSVTPGIWTVTTPNYTGKLKEYTQPSRYLYHRLRAESKSLIIFNPDQRPDQELNAGAIVERINTNKNKASAIFDLSKVYHRDVLEYKRGIALVNNRRVIMIQDEFKLKRPSKVWWFMPMPMEIEYTISNDGKTVILKSGNERMWVCLRHSTENARFTVRKTEPLKETEIDIINNVKSIEFPHKLAIEMDNIINQKINVTFVPLDNGENEPSFELEPIINIEKW